MSVPVCIVGAGPTGLAAAIELRDQGHETHVFESASAVSGLSCTVRDDRGFAWEMGGHVTYSHFDRFDRFFEEYITDRYNQIERESWVYCEKQWIPYPLQNNLRYLGNPHDRVCVEQLVHAQQTSVHRFGSLKEAVRRATTFQHVIDRVFGRGIAERFMEPYNRKVWATDPKDMAADWLGERVALLDAERARRNVEEGLDDFGWGPNNTFRFPVDGTGALYEAMAADLPTPVALNHRLIRVDADRRVAEFETPDGTLEVSFDHLVSTIPLDVLITRVLKDAPVALAEAARDLRYATGDFVGIGLRTPCPNTRSWMYFPDPELPFYRVTYLSNYSPSFAPDGCHSLLCEASSPPGTRRDPAQLIEQTLTGLEACGLLGTPETGTRDDIISTWHARAERSYPVPTVARDRALSTILPWLEERGIYSRGRFGLWKYEVANTDHSVMQGVEVVRRILNGEPETVIGIQYDDGIRHYRSTRAGSGERRDHPIRPTE